MIPSSVISVQETTLEEHKKLVEANMKRDKKKTENSGMQHQWLACLKQVMKHSDASQLSYSSDNHPLIYHQLLKPRPTN